MIVRIGILILCFFLHPYAGAESLSGNIVQVTRQLVMSKREVPSAKEFYIDRGEQDGVRAGHVFEVFRIQPVISAFTGDPIAANTINNAEITATLAPTAQAAREFLRNMMTTGEGWPFVPLYNPDFIPASEADYLQPLDLVLGITING